MKKPMLCFAVFCVFFLFFLLGCNPLAAQSEVSGWGNLRGIRVGGQLIAFSTAVGVYNTENFSRLTLSQREGPISTSRYVRNANSVTVGERLQYGSRRGAANQAAGFGRRRGGGTGSTIP